MDNVLSAFGLKPDNFHATPFGSGLINHTWKVSGDSREYVLQQINKNVFKVPQDIADNLVQLESYLKQTAPNYLFAAPLPTITGAYLAEDAGNYYRLSQFIKNSHSVDFIGQAKQACEAAKQFGKFTRLLKDFDPAKLKYTLADFHNLTLRVEQFKTALANADNERLKTAATEITKVEANIGIAHVYAQLVNDRQIPMRVIHHDTKINNILFDDNNFGLCVIDLDTVMPGYFISDVGDMMRTYLSPANEEERDLSKVQINHDYFVAVYKGYMEEMGGTLTAAEKDLFIYSGKFMIYMQAIRFLTDFLNGDVYYQTQYAGHNLVRTQNQLTLLERYLQSEDTFYGHIKYIEKGAVSAI
jgi:Ser/Thr protein kinase RdoA (MazF antagonist)